MKSRIEKNRLAPDPETGWERWKLTVDGTCIGELFEHRRWTGTRYGARRWVAVHNPTLAPYAALFATDPQPSMRAAMQILEAHVSSLP